MNNVNEQCQCSFDPLASHIIIIVIVSLPIIPVHFSGIVRVVFSSSEDLTRGHSTRVVPGDNKGPSCEDLLPPMGSGLGQPWSAVDKYRKQSGVPIDLQNQDSMSDTQTTTEYVSMALFHKLIALSMGQHD